MEGGQMAFEPEVVPSSVASWQLMDAGLAFAPRLRAELQRSVEDVARFSLPVWIGNDGSLRIALPVDDPAHGADNVQIIAPLGEVLEAVGQAVREAADRAAASNQHDRPAAGTPPNQEGHRHDEP